MSALTAINIDEFAAAVRAELADLPKREIQDLTDGLEADLSERLAEEGASFNPGTPSAYATELREAAGVAPKNSKFKFFSAAALSAGIVELANRNVVGKSIFNFAVSIRPVWWVLRAAVAFLIVDVLSQGALPNWSLPILVLISVQWGRKKWLTHKFFASILLPLNLLALVLIVPSTAIVSSRISEYYTLQEIVGNLPARDGLRLNGDPIREIKAFDKDKKEITGLVFTDSEGNQLLPSETTPGAIQIPDVTGLTIGDMQTALTDAGIQNVEFNRLDNGLDSEVVVKATQPAAGAWIDPTSTLLVIVGKP